jgi:predicted MFS family arabinose efflux permease
MTGEKLSRMGVLVTLMLVYATSQIDRQLLGILLEPIRHEFRINDTQLGLLSGLAFGAFYATLGIPFALLADRMNRRNLVSVALALWSIATGLCGLAANFGQLIVCRAAVGVGESGSLPTSHSMIADLYGREDRATAMGILSIGANLGVMTAFAAGGLIGAAWGWRAAFLIFSAVGIPLALFVRFAVAEPVRAHANVTSTAPMASVALAVRHIAATPSLRRLLIAWPVSSLVSYAFLAWFPAYLIRMFGGTTGTVGLTLSIVIGAGGCLGTLFGGIVADRLGRYDTRWHVRISAIALVIAVPFFCASLLANNYWVAIALFIAPAFLGIVYSGPNFALVQGLFPPQMRALGAAIYLFVVNLTGLSLGPFLVGWLSDAFKHEMGNQSLRWALMAMSVFWLIGAVLFARTGQTLANDLAVQGDNHSGNNRTLDASRERQSRSA